MTTTTYHILINPAAASGRGRKVWKKIRPELERLGVSYRQFFPATPDHAREIIRGLEKSAKGTGTLAGESWGTGTMTHFSLHSEQPSMYAKNESLYPSPLTHPLHLIVIGGDGTMSTVVNSINDFTRFRIGYIPAGSANDLALSLGLSDDPLENLSSILEGTVRRHLDVGVVDGAAKGTGTMAGESWGTGTMTHFSELGEPPQMTEKNESLYLSPLTHSPHRFLVSAGIGFDAAVCEGVNGSTLKKLLSKVGLSKLSYIMIALKILLTEKKAACTVTMDDGAAVHHMDRSLFAAVMLERFEGGGFMFAPDADPEDGLFDLCMIGDISAPRFILSLPKAKRGTHFSIKGADHALASKVTIHTDTPLYVHADGDVIARSSDITFTCLPRVLQLLN